MLVFRLEGRRWDLWLAEGGMGLGKFSWKYAIWALVSEVPLEYAGWKWTLSHNKDPMNRYSHPPVR
jgi:hypothetical protein